MPFASQFSLSLELTNLIPLTLAAAGKTYEAAMSLARDLQSSGSDIVVEEDIAELFGRARIADNIASSFRTLMSKPGEFEHWHNGLGLLLGQGPTTVRALAEPHYFATIVQCSFLVSVHERASLAAAIASYFEKIAEQAPSRQQRRAAPSLESIRGMLRACEDQTESYDWRRMLIALATTLGLGEDAIHETMPSSIFHGLITMLPIVQTLPEDRSIVIETENGVCSIVCWAHIILGLSVLVRFYLDDECVEVRLPKDRTSSEQVLIDCRAHLSQADPTAWPVRREPSVTLLSTADKETLFSLRADPDDDTIDATFKTPIKGLAHRILRSSVEGHPHQDRLIQEVGLIACAFSLCIAKQLHMTYDLSLMFEDGYYESFSDGQDLDLERVIPDSVAYPISLESIFDAAGLLLDLPGRRLNRKLAEDYASLYQGESLYSIQDPPRCIALILGEHVPQRWGRKDNPDWSTLCHTAIQLSILILAFSHISNLRDCADMLVSEIPGVLAKSDLSIKLAAWNGESPIPIRADVWLQIIALLMVGHSETAPDLNNTCLLSNRGWSVFLSSFGGADPAYVAPGALTAKRGVPFRNGIWKHEIVDGPQHSRERNDWRGHGQMGNKIGLTCAIKVAYAKPLIGERGDRFLVTLRLLSTAIAAAATALPENICRTGYNELWSSLWAVVRTPSCPHPSLPGDTQQLEPGWVTISGFSEEDHREVKGTVKICLTAGSAAARWRTLLSIKTHGECGVLLRTPDCCLRCATGEASRREGPWYIVL